METEKKSIFSTGFRRLRIEKRKSLIRRLPAEKQLSYPELS